MSEWTLIVRLFHVAILHKSPDLWHLLFATFFATFFCHFFAGDLSIFNCSKPNWVSHFNLNLNQIFKVAGQANGNGKFNSTGFFAVCSCCDDFCNIYGNFVFPHCPLGKYCFFSCHQQIIPVFIQFVYAFILQINLLTWGATAWAALVVLSVLRLSNSTNKWTDGQRSCKLIKCSSYAPLACGKIKHRHSELHCCPSLEI